MLGRVSRNQGGSMRVVNRMRMVWASHVNWTRIVSMTLRDAILCGTSDESITYSSVQPFFQIGPAEILRRLTDIYYWPTFEFYKPHPNSTWCVRLKLNSFRKTIAETGHHSFESKNRCLSWYSCSGWKLCNENGIPYCSKFIGPQNGTQKRENVRNANDTEDILRSAFVPKTA